MNQPVTKILLVEDDPDLGNVLKQYLALNHYDVHLCKDGEEGIHAFKEKEFDICILDIMMPKMDGFMLAEHIYKLNPEVPFIFLTAKVLKEDKIKGLKLGADDYISKPFEPEELVLRIQNILRRRGTGKNDIIKVGSYELDVNNLLLSCNTKKYQLTEKEVQLLQYLIRNQNKVLKRSQILIKFWGKDDYFCGRSMDVFISRLRKYLKHDKSLRIKSIRGVGYCFELKQ